VFSTIFLIAEKYLPAIVWRVSFPEVDSGVVDQAERYIQQTVILPQVLHGKTQRFGRIVVLPVPVSKLMILLLLFIVLLYKNYVGAPLYARKK